MSEYSYVCPIHHQAGTGFFGIECHACPAWRRFLQRLRVYRWVREYHRQQPVKESMRRAFGQGKTRREQGVT